MAQRDDAALSGKRSCQVHDAGDLGHGKFDGAYGVMAGLEVLRVLQKSYYGKVKMIYIDPPYNTGNDFIYEDDFSETPSDFLKRSNQVDQRL